MWWMAGGEHEVPASFDWLSPRELEHLESIRFTKRRTEYVTRRWTAKQAIAASLDLDTDLTALARIEVRHHAGGAPYVAVDGAGAAVDISLSDRAGWAVCLVGPTRDAAAGTLGIDLEIVEPRSDTFVADYFTATEREYVAALGSIDERHVAANLIWSAKEAALKVQQVGLRADTRTVEVVLDHRPRSDGWAAMTVSGSNGDMPGWWRRDGVFLLTIAFATATDPPQLMSGSSDLLLATPQHSWVERPVW